ncbi:hypothetical protein RB195_020809 [Necator americanus]|uniref:Uncharacterized protein n=1 Tax=Necator americanus TaxID=51031 RepID=A0ABR1CKM6_NECAM
MCISKKKSGNTMIVNRTNYVKNSPQPYSVPLSTCSHQNESAALVRMFAQIFWCHFKFAKFGSGEKNRLDLFTKHLSR